VARVIDVAFVLVHTTHRRHLRIATCAHGSDHTLENAIGCVIEDPSSTVVFENFVNLGVEPRSRVQTISFPKLLDLADNLLTIGVSTLPLDGWMETIHKGMDLKAGGVVYLL
jgi:hypothetical protein